jgi:hypothetical protein
MEKDKISFFNNKDLRDEALEFFKNFEFKLFGKRGLNFYRGQVDEFEFDLNLGVIHFTELDCKGISAFIENINKKYDTEMTYCIYPAKEKNRDMILNVRLPGAPFELE